MASYSVDDIIGKNLVAKKNLIAYFGYPLSSSTFNILKGNNVGTVYSYVKDSAGNIYWQFFDRTGKGFYVKHSSDSFDMESLNAQGVTSLNQQNIEKVEKQKLEDKGAFVYYVEKWGGKILLTGAAIWTVVTLVKEYNKPYFKLKSQTDARGKTTHY